MSEFSKWRECLERAEARLHALDSAAQPLPPEDEEVELWGVVSNIRKTLPKAMRQFLKAVRPPPPEKANLRNINLADLARLTAQGLDKDGLSELGPRVHNTLAIVLAAGHPDDVPRELKRDRVRGWLSASFDFLDAIEPRLT